MQQWQITQGRSRAMVQAVNHAAAIERAARIGFKQPDSVCLVEDAGAMRDRAIAAWATLSAFKSAPPIPV